MKKFESGVNKSVVKSVILIYVMLPNAVRFGLRAVVIGVEEDLVTKRYDYRVDVGSGGKEFPVGLVSTYCVDEPDKSGKKFTIRVEDLYTCLSELESNGFVTYDIPNPNVINHVI